MSYDQDDFMRLDSASEESQHSAKYEERLQDDQSTYSAATDGSDDRIDNKIMEYLLNGYALASMMCPSCNTPLIKKFIENQDNNSSLEDKRHEEGTPVDCIPFCASCKAVVVTTNRELQIMWRNENKYLMGIEGAVHLAINEAHGAEVDEMKRAMNQGMLDSVSGQEDDAANEADYTDGYQVRSEVVAHPSNEDDHEEEKRSTSDEIEETRVHNVTFERNGDSDNHDAKDHLEMNPAEEVDMGLIDYKKR
jgi:hypothetical protein